MAEWVQVRAGSTIQTGLERGRWYRVDTHVDGTIRVLGPGVLDAIPDTALRVMNREPDFVTRIQAADFQVIRPGSPMPPLQYYGVCPAGHHIKRVAAGETEAHCPQCDRTYRVEDEQ